MKLRQAVNGVEGTTRIFALLCGYACLGLSFLIGYEILARQLWGHSLQGVDEIGGYVLAATGAVGFAYALMHQAHTRVDLALNLSGHRVRSVLNVLALVGLAVFAVFMAVRAYDALAESMEFNSHASTPLQTPLWIPQTVWVVGLVLFAFIAVCMVLHSIWLLFNDRSRLNKAYGPVSLQDEVDEQMAEAKRVAEFLKKEDKSND